MIDLRLLHSFRAIVRCGGFTRAAERLNSTQPTLSQHLRRLEEQTGRLLLNRSSRSFTLTEDGEALLGYADRLIELHDEMRAHLSRRALEGRLRVGVLEDFANQQLPRMLASFGRAFPGVRVAVRCGLSVTSLADLRRGDLDLAITRARGQDLRCEVLRAEPLQWVAASGTNHAAAARLPLVLFADGCAYRPVILRRLKAAGIPFSIVYTSNSLAGVLAAVRAGLGVTALAESSLRPDLARLGSDLALPDLPPSELCLCSRPGEPPNPVAEAFVEFLRSNAALIETAGGSG